MSSLETAVLDPAEFSVGRTELPLDTLGLDVANADWGDADIELFLVKQALGEVPADRHPPNRQISFDLRVRAEGAVTLAQAAQKLQQKIGLFQREDGGWLRRDMDPKGLFLSSVGFPIRGASLSGLDGWYMAHRQAAPDVKVQLTAGPYCYGTGELASSTFTETVERDLRWSLAGIKGSAPGLIRCIVGNSNAAGGDWFSCISAIESRDSSSASTAALAYEAEALTPLGTSAIATLTGASGGGSNNAIKVSPLSATPQSVLSSKIVSGSAQMTHVGNRRVYVRVNDPSTNAGEINFRLEWRALGAPYWTQNNICPTQVSAGNFSIIDLGECRPKTAILGSQQWEWRITAWTTGTAGSQPYLDKFWILPSEQFAKTSGAVSLVTPTLFSAWDGFDQAAGALTGKTLPVGGTWAGAGSGTDATVSGSSNITRATISEGHFAGRFLTASSPTLTNAGAQVDVNNSALPPKTVGASAGVLLRYIDTNNWLSVVLEWDATNQFLKVTRMVAGVTTIMGTSVKLAVNTFYTVSAVVSAQGILNAQVCIQGSATPIATYQSQSSVLATGGALASGKIGMYDVNQDLNVVTRTLDNFSAWVPDTNVICSSGRSMEFRSDGVFRQDPSVDVWGQIIPDGFLPYSPPAGLEGRTARGIIIPSQGDMDLIPDSNSNKMSLQIKYFPGYHFTSEGG